MDKVILVIGLVIIAEGISVIIKPQWILKVARFFTKGLFIYLPGLLRVALGVVFLMSFRDCKIKWLIMTFGIITISSGVLLVIIKPSKLRSIIEWWSKRSLFTIRVMGLLAAILGGVIVYGA